MFSLGRACTNDVEQQVFFIVKLLNFQKVTITLQDNADEIPLHFNMPYNYTIDDKGVKMC
jgi:hypothetical protein